MTGQTILLGLVLVAVALVMWTTMRRAARSRRTGVRPTHADREVRDVRQQMERLLVEIHDVSREMNARLDTKISVLNSLVNEADEKIRRLEKLSRETGRGSGSPVPAVPEPTSDAPPEPRPQDDPLSEPDPGQRYAEIYALSDQGLDAHQIAQKTGQHPGEVQLILGLRSKRAD